ncbi:hypothetical protein MRX96_028789 [Rhipicephalus microplus]
MGTLGKSASAFVTMCSHHVRSGIYVKSVRFRRKGFVRTAQKVIYPTSETEGSTSVPPASDNVPRYVKLGCNDDEFANTMMQLKMKRKREKLNKVLLEGKRLIADALKAGVECESIYFSLPENIRRSAFGHTTGGADKEGVLQEDENLVGHDDMSRRNG